MNTVTTLDDDVTTVKDHLLHLESELEDIINKYNLIEHSLSDQSPVKEL